MKSVFRNIYFTHSFYFTGVFLVLIFIFSWVFPNLLLAAKIVLFVFLLYVIVDAFLLFSISDPVSAVRIVSDRLSNGDSNPIELVVRSSYAFTIHVVILEEAPWQFQLRSLRFHSTLRAGQEKSFRYELRPVKRGEYGFGHIIICAKSPLRMVERRCISGKEKLVKVYPSFIQMRKYELLAATDRLIDAGIKTVRKIGHQLEFEHIRDYVSGDDSRIINWKATALRAKLMVNQYQDEKSQPVYCLIDMGRSMQMPFKEMSLLDYSINSSLIISNVALLKQDRAGLLCFNTDVHRYLPADRKSFFILRIMEALYRLETQFGESDYELLYSAIRNRIKQRSLLILFTNFESRISLSRHIQIFKRISRAHPLLVIFFENSGITELAKQQPANTEEIYIQTLAGQLLHEKRQMVHELNRFGIFAMLTTPERLTIDVINRYLEFKAMGVI